MVERDEPADDRLLPNREPDAMTVLEREGRLFVREPELLCLRPYRGDLSGRSSRSDQLDCSVEVIAAAFIGIHHGVRGITDGEAAIVAGTVAHVRLQNIVVDRVAGPEHSVRVDVRVRIAALTGNRVHRLNVL